MDERMKLRIDGIIVLVVALICLVMTGTFGDADNLLGLDLGGLSWIEDVIYVISALVAFGGGIIILKSLQSENRVQDNE
ncbi:MAG: hypothetical protein ACFFGZ_03575 [Candidatus Thorarchaeota archaeon]